MGSSLDWQPKEGAEEFEVATLKVPLDHREPGGEQIDLAVIRRRAADPARRIGSLVFVSGGPAFPGVTLLPAHYPFLPAEVRERFDVIGFDPRGAGESTPVQGFSSMQELGEFFGDLPLPFPVTEKEKRLWIDKFTAFAQIVRERNEKLLPHISSADIARDMDLLRQAVGEDTLNYLGVSFGSLPGITYANLFPDKVRSMALDATIDPVDWFTDDRDPTLNATLRLGFDVSAARGVDRFLSLGGEAGPKACAFAAEDAQATRAKFRTMLERLRERPVTLATPKGPQTVTYPIVIANLWVTLYQIGYWQAEAEILQEIWLATERPEEEGPLETKLDVLESPAGTELPPLFAAPPEWSIAFLGGDTPNPSDPQSWFAQGEIAERRSGGMGSVVNWGSVACAAWTPGENRYTGPWDRPTAAPILLIGTVGDPGTSYEATVELAGRLADARLLTVDGEGHSAFYNPNPHVAAALGAYFADGVLPEPGASVPPAHHPFPS